MLGAGFNCSILDPTRGSAAPLAQNFFEVLLADPRNDLGGFRRHVFVDVLLEEIERYWHLDLDGLRTQPFDIEECLTLFESQADDAPDDDTRLRLLRASFALRQMLLTHLGHLTDGGSTPTARRFGDEVHSTEADVLTFNYDTLAEESIASASGFGTKVFPDSLRGGPPDERELSDEDLDASHHAWKSALAVGFKFDEVELPVAGPSTHVEGPRYYSHPNNKLYDSRRVLKLHGSIDWLRYTDRREFPQLENFQPRDPRTGIVLAKSPPYWYGETLSHDVWQMEPIIIPPLLYKRFDHDPFPAVWQAALQTLSECHTLIVIGYSFPPTDFRTRRLFLEAFTEPHLSQLVVINPDPSVAGTVRQLTDFKGAATVCDDLRAFYGAPASWFDLTGATPGG